MTHEEWNEIADTNEPSPGAAPKQPQAALPSRPWQQRLVIGITAFRRPRLLERLVASIQQRYPGLPIVVADNGDEPARLPAAVRVLQLPFDCGVSQARNALVAATSEEFFLLLEEDFCFTDDSRIEDFVDVLEHDPEIGVVGGSLFVNGVKQEYNVRIDRLRDRLRLEQATGGHRVTGHGVTYQVCDMCFNFALFRRAMLGDHRWNERLKLGEHYAYFEAVCRAGLWRVAVCDSVRAIHDMSERGEHYQKYRRRARNMHIDYLRSIGVRGLEADPRIQLRTSTTPALLRPNVLILGVGHSGTSILSRMLLNAGWRCDDADDEFSESAGARAVNSSYLQTREFDLERAAPIANRLGPWVLKDPRFVHTLGRWKALFAKQHAPPVLVWIQREFDQVVASYLRRGELQGVRPETAIRNRLRLAERQYDEWPWGKLALQYEDLDACAQFVAANWRMKQRDLRAPARPETLSRN